MSCAIFAYTVLLVYFCCFLQFAYDEVSRKLNSGVPNAKKLIMRSITLTWPIPNSALTIFSTIPTLYHGHKLWLIAAKMYWKPGGFFSVKKINPKYGSTMKNLNNKNFPIIFPVVYVGTMSMTMTMSWLQSKVHD